MNALTAGDALAHPLVLRAAWLRVNGWYRAGNFAPQPELASWRLHPERELRNLADALKDEQWKPSVWSQLPYPKKGARLRHYLLPTVRDQVAFMAHLVLLGPLLDSRTAEFVFGNRWYRPIIWDRRRPQPRWQLLPYPLLDDRSYLPYRRSHGLYRRVAHWTVTQMTGATLRTRDYSGPVQLPDDYDTEELPAWVRPDWWGQTGPSESAEAFWATLDIEMAYPSVRLRELSGSALSMVADLDDVPLDEKLDGYPSSLRMALKDVGVRLELVERLVDALRNVTIHTHRIPRDGWRPHHARSELPPHNKGIPTGLAVSGLLMNVALNRADRTVMQYLVDSDAASRGAIIRFADDMVIFSRSVHGLLCLIDTLWGGIAGDDNAALASGQSLSNLYLNLAKIQPAPVKDLVRRYLLAHDWSECKLHENCDHLEHPMSPRRITRLSAWYAHKRDTRELRSIREALDRTRVRSGEVGPFVTTLVERLSDIGNDTLSERFGAGAENRLVQLHDLARLDIDDQQVRPETRRAFAVNRLVRTWLPGDEDDVGTALSDICSSVGHVLEVTPWKDSLWRAVVRAAVRWAVATNDSLEDGRDWLLAQLRHIAHRPATTSDLGSWMRRWPEEMPIELHKRNPSWRPLYLSYLRATFWRALAGVLRELSHDLDELERAGPLYLGRSPRAWVARAVPEEACARAIEFLSDLDCWTEELYTREPCPDLREWPWELDHLVEAVLASFKRADIFEAWRRSGRVGAVLSIPEEIGVARVPLTHTLLRDCQRVVPATEMAGSVNRAAVAHIALGARDSRLGPNLFSTSGRTLVLEAGDEPRHAVVTAASLGCSDSINATLANQVVARFGSATEIHADPLSLREYELARHVVLSHRLSP